MSKESRLLAGNTLWHGHKKDLEMMSITVVVKLAAVASHSMKPPPIVSSLVCNLLIVNIIEIEVKTKKILDVWLQV